MTAVLLLAAAWAQTTPAGVIITNQASADFIDSGGNGQTTLSNAVEVVVLPIYSFNIEPDRDGTGGDQDPTGGAANNGGLDATPTNTANPDGINTLTDVDAGSTVTFSYTLDNDANINDVFALEVRQDTDDDFDFTGIQIFTFDDLNNDGIYNPATEAGTLSIQGGNTATISLTADDGAGIEDGGAGGLVGTDSTNIVVFATVPAGTPGSEVALLDLVATSQGANAAGDTEPNVLYENNNVSSATVNETPVIGISEGISNVTNNGDGTYTVTYELLVENLGNVDLDNISLTNSMADTFLNDPPAANQAGGITIDSVNVGGFTPNPTAYDGDGVTELLDPASTLAIGATETVEIVVTVTNPDVGFVYNNQTIALGTSTGASGATVGDYSDDGTPPFAAGDPDPNNNNDPGADAGAGDPPLPEAGADPDVGEDTPTPVSFTENPQIGISKQLNAVTPVVGSPGEYNVGFTLRIENFGDVPLSNIQVEEDLAAAFGFPPTLVGNTTVVGITAGPTTPATTNDGNPGFIINTTYDGVGNNDLLQGVASLAVDDFTTIAFTVRINIDSDGPGGTDAGPGSYINTATATGESPSGTPVEDDSQNGPDPDPDGNDDPTDNDDPTPVNITEEPILGVGKDVGTISDNGDGSYNVPYIITVENFGNVPLTDLQVTDNLTNTFVNPTAPQPVFNVIAGSVASPTLAVNAGFDGVATGDTNLLAGTDTLAIGATATITFTVRVEPNVAQGVYDNQAFGSGDSPGGTTVTDTSQDDGDPDDNSADPTVNNDGDPSNNSDPTRIVIPSDPVIGVAKRLSGVEIDTPAAGTYRVTYLIEVENLGAVPLTNVQVQDNLTTTFGTTTFAIIVAPTATGALTANGGYDGVSTGDINLLDATSSTLAVNTTETITLVVDVTPASVPTRQYDNQAFGSATDPSGGLTTEDPSDNGFDPDPDGDDNPNETDDGVPGNGDDSDSNENDPTPLIILGPSDLELSKTQYICEDADGNGILDDTTAGTCDIVVAGGAAPGVDTQLTADPGQYIVYTVVGANNSGNDITDVFINDVIPANTVFVNSALNTATPAGTFECRVGAVWAACPGAVGTEQPTVVEVRLRDNGGTVADTESRTLTFVVRIP